MSLEQHITSLLRCHSEERRAKRVKFENIALAFERQAATGEDQWLGLADAAAQLRALAAEIYP